MLAAMASARWKSSGVKGSWSGPRSRCKTPRRLRGERSSTQMIDAMAPEEMLHACWSSRSKLTLRHNNDLPFLKQCWDSVRLKTRLEHLDCLEKEMAWRLRSSAS